MTFYKYIICICQKGPSSGDELSGHRKDIQIPYFLCVIKRLGAISRRTWEHLCFQGARQLLTLHCNLHLKHVKTTLPWSFCFCRTTWSHQLSENAGYSYTRNCFPDHLTFNSPPSPLPERLFAFSQRQVEWGSSINYSSLGFALPYISWINPNTS